VEDVLEYGADTTSWRQSVEKSGQYYTATADVAIVGAGPIGLEMAATLKRAGVEYLHFDAAQHEAN
jgi:NADPH-dependent 2,4-dienoyl-CoA reductase/sulfur reductase-like enzyme